MIQTEEADYGRDMNSKALINKNVTAFEQYKKTKEQANRLSALEKSTSELKSDIAELKSMLIQILDR